MTHLENLVVFLFIYLYIYNQSQSSSEWNHSSNLDYLFKFRHSTLQWQPKRDPRWPAREQRCIENLKVGCFFSPWTDALLCDFIQLQSIYLSQNVNTDVEQWQEGMNSPVPQHTHYIVSNTHTYTHTLAGVCLSSPVKTSVCSPFSFPIWCVKSGRKSKPFPSFWPMWVVVPWGRRGETGSKVLLSLQSLWKCVERHRLPKTTGKTIGQRHHGGRGKGRWSKNRISTARGCILSLSVTRVPLLPSSLNLKLFICLFNWVTNFLAISHSPQKMRKVCSKNNLDFFPCDLDIFFSNLNANNFEDIMYRKCWGPSFSPIWWQHRVSTCLQNLKYYWGF